MAVGVRVFSDDEAERGAFAIGLDYKLRSNSWRPNAGVAYLDEDFYIDLSVGYDFNAGEVDFGAGLGLTNNVKKTAPVTPAATPTVTTTSDPTPVTTPTPTPSPTPTPTPDPGPAPDEPGPAPDEPVL